MTVRPRSESMEPSFLPRIDPPDTEPCEPYPESEATSRKTVPPTLEQLAADAEHHRMVREAALEASGILSSTLIEILHGQREIDRKLGMLIADRERLDSLEERIARIESCCQTCPRRCEEPVQ